MDDACRSTIEQAFRLGPFWAEDYCHEDEGARLARPIGSHIAATLAFTGEGVTRVTGSSASGAATGAWPM